MRLGVLLPPLAGPAAGLAVYVREVVPRLLRLHPETTLFTAEIEELPGWSESARVVRLGRGLLTRAARRVHSRLGRLLAVQGALRRELGRREVDALLVPFHDGILHSPVPQAVVVHDLSLLRRPAPPRSGPARAYMRLLFRRVAHGTALVVAVSESTASDLQATWGLRPERLRVIREGFDQALFRPFDTERIAAARERHGLDQPYLLYAGTYSPHKNLGTAIAALAALDKKRPDLVLAVAGPTGAGDFKAFEGEVQRAGVEDRVRVLGYLDRADLGPLMAGAVAFVFPSLREGFGLAVLEAMASGAAVLASDRTSLPELVGDGGLLLAPDRPQEWSAAIQRLLDRPDEDRALRRRAVERAALFDWETTAAEILDLLLGLTSERETG